MGSLDIETFNYLGVHIPYAIGYYVFYKGISYRKIYLLSDYMIDNIDIRLASFNMLMACLSSLKLLIPKNIKFYIYVHNLGNFDGYLLFNVISILFDDFKFLIDESNTFIEFRFANIIMKDSYRILPASLDKLTVLVPNCNRKLKFNHSLVTYDMVVSDCSFIVDYLNNDVHILYVIITYYAKYLNETYHINFFKIYSASNLAFTIFRTNYYKYENISIMTLSMYPTIKQSYYGGNFISTANYGNNLYYYDVNSLYPYAMLNDMPGKYIRYMDNIDYDNFINSSYYFGFFNCTIYVPDDNNISIIISKDINTHKLIYPKGIITGLYFSEEIKNWIKLGYKVEVHNGYIFSRINSPFKE